MWFVKNEMYEKAIEFFERASEIQPADVKWKLMVASCHRRMTNYAKALECYEAIHAQHPDDVECTLGWLVASALVTTQTHTHKHTWTPHPTINAGLRYLVALCRELGRKYDHYDALLQRIERARSPEHAAGGAGGGMYADGSDDDYGGGLGGYGDGYDAGGYDMAAAAAAAVVAVRVRQPPPPLRRVAAVVVEEAGRQHARQTAGLAAARTGMLRRVGLACQWKRRVAQARATTTLVTRT